MAERERLTLVTDFASLKAGDLVVVKPCGNCGEPHRTMLTSIGWGIVGHKGGPSISHPWDCTPDHFCHDSTFCVSEFAVREGRVYLVDTGLDLEETTENDTANPNAIRRAMGLERVR